MPLAEGRSNAELKRQNYSKILTAGLPIVKNPQFGYNAGTVGELMLPDGNIIRGSSLFFDLGEEVGTIALGGENDKLAEFKYYAEAAEGGILLLKLLTNTFVGEGAGFGSAMFSLGDTLVENIAPHFDGYNAVFAEGEDCARNRNTSSSRKEWSSEMMRASGYTDNAQLLKQFGLNFRTRKMFLKKLA